MQKAEAIQGKVFSVQDMGFQKAIRGLKMFFEREVQPHLIRHEGFLKPSEMRNKKHRRELKRRRKAAEKALERENQRNRQGGRKSKGGRSYEAIGRWRSGGENRIEG